jgi:formylglycine-generating enzyme required for sulfatase activity
MRGRALIIATGQYRDSQLKRLAAAGADAAGLREVLSDPGIGNFEVGECVDSPGETVRRRIGSFFSRASRDELLLLYVSGHGVKDRDGRLYFAAADTLLEELLATGIPASFIHEAVNGSPSRRIVLIFDTCFSGAFARGFQARDGSQAVNAADYFREGTGTAVITASNAIQYALEAGGDSIDQIAEPSLFSRHIINGLRSGQADIDGDGQVSLDDLFQYVSSEVRGETTSQQPQRWYFGLDGQLVIATNPLPRAGKLPPDVIGLIENPSYRARLLAVEDLERLLAGKDRSLALAAREALERLQKDEDQRVSRASAAVLREMVTRRPKDQLATGEQQAAAAREAGPLRRQAETEEQRQQQQQAKAKLQAERGTHEAAQRREGAAAPEPRGSQLMLPYRPAITLAVIITLLAVAVGVYLYLNQRLLAPPVPAAAGPDAPPASDQHSQASQASAARSFATSSSAPIQAPAATGSRSNEAPTATLTVSGHRVGETFRDCEQVCPEMVVIPPGRFQMGSPSSEQGRDDNEGPVHEVRIGYVFAAAKYPVTRGEWRPYLAATGRSGSNNCFGFNQSTGQFEQQYDWQDPGFPQDDNHPVVCVNWDEAQGYASWLSAKTGHRYRLLSEAEYEYIERAGSSSAYFWGDTADGQCRYANGGDVTLKERSYRWVTVTAACSDGHAFTSPVGKYQPNRFSLYDITGNVRSWTQDCYHDSYSGAPQDGSAWTTGGCDQRAFHGGSWDSRPSGLRAASRYRDSAKGASFNVGFRLARTK